MNSPTSSCVLDVPGLNHDQATRLCKSLASKLPGSVLEYATDAGTLRVDNVKPIKVFEHLDHCVEQLTWQRMVNEDGQILANPSAISARDAGTGANHRHVILHHPDGSMSIIPGGEPKLDDNLSWESMHIEQHHRQGTEEASVCQGALTITRGQGWSHAATQKYDFPKRPDPGEVRLEMLMTGTHQITDVPSQGTAYSVI